MYHPMKNQKQEREEKLLDNIVSAFILYLFIYIYIYQFNLNDYYVLFFYKFSNKPTLFKTMFR